MLVLGARAVRVAEQIASAHGRAAKLGARRIVVWGRGMRGIGESRRLGHERRFGERHGGFVLVVVVAHTSSAACGEILAGLGPSQQILGLRGRHGLGHVFEAHRVVDGVGQIEPGLAPHPARSPPVGRATR